MGSARRRQNPDGSSRPDYENVRDSGELFRQYTLLNKSDADAVHDLIMATANHLQARTEKHYYAGFSPAFSSCDRGRRWPGGVCPLKAGVISGEQPKGRPVEPSPSVRNHADETIMDEARDGHRHRSPFRLRKRQPKILDRETPAKAGYLPGQRLQMVNSSEILRISVERSLEIRSHKVPGDRGGRRRRRLRAATLPWS